MKIKHVRPYNSKIDAFRGIIKRELFAEAGRAKDRLKIAHERIGNQVNEMNLIDKESDAHVAMQHTYRALLATQERMEITAAVWDTVISIYSKVEEEYERLYAAMKEESA